MKEYPELNIKLHIETDKKKEFIEQLDDLCYKFAKLNYHFEKYGRE